MSPREEYRGIDFNAARNRTPSFSGGWKMWLFAAIGLVSFIVTWVSISDMLEVRRDNQRLRDELTRKQDQMNILAKDKQNLTPQLQNCKNQVETLNADLNKKKKDLCKPVTK